jgi:NAD(P)-dependent dehydrogenase (short-subunit alcohol dehydrogenase family)
MKSVLITGAAQGIGAATARTMAHRGWRVLLADLHLDKARAVAEELQASSPVEGGHQAIAVDVSSADSVLAAVEAVHAHGDGLNGLVNCAGILTRQPAEDTDLPKWQAVLDTHLNGAMLMSRELFPLLKAAKGSIVNIASVGSTLGLPGRLAYTVAKSGILGMTRTLAVEWGHHGLRVNAVAPGYVDTEMIRSGFREGTLNEAELLRRTPLGRLAQADDIASAIAFLLGHDARFVHGVTLKVDGGITIDGSFN